MTRVLSQSKITYDVVCFFVLISFHFPSLVVPHEKLYFTNRLLRLIKLFSGINSSFT